MQKKNVYRSAVAVLTLGGLMTAFAAVDENGIEPAHWYKFDGNRDSSGASPITFNGGYGSISFAEAVSGQAFLVGDKARPWCSKHAALGDAFTFVTAAKGTTGTEKRVLWGRGDAYGRSIGFFIQGTTAGLFAWDNNSTKKTGWSSDNAARVLVSASVPSAATAYHSYAVAYANGVFSIYVDGVKKSDSSSATDMIALSDLSSGDGSFQFGSMHGILAGGMSNGDGCLIDDYRFYSQALSSEQIAAIAAPYATPEHWYKFDGDLTSFGTTAIAIEGGTDACKYFDSADGQALAAGSPWCGGHAGFTSAFTFVTVAKTSPVDQNSILWARGKKDSKSIGLYSNRSKIVLFAAGTGWNDGSSARKIVETTVTDAATAFHSYGVVYADGVWSLYVDGEKAGDSSQLTVTIDPSDIGNANFQFNSLYGGVASGLTVNSGALLDDYRYYTRALSATELQELAEPVAGVPALSFRFCPTVSDNVPWGWFSSWEWNGFSGSDVVSAPGDFGLVYPTKSGSTNHGGTGLAAADKRTFAVYADLSGMKFSETGVYYTILCVGGSTSGNQSVNLVSYQTAQGRRMVRLAYVKSGKHDGQTDAIDITDLSGYHLYTFTYDSAVGTALTIDAAEAIVDASDKAKFIPTAGLQVGATWQNQVFRLTEGAAVAQVLGYDTVLTRDAILALAAKYPANGAATSDIDTGDTARQVVSRTIAMAPGKRIGISNGSWTIPEGCEVTTERVRTLNTSQSTNVVDVTIDGKLTLSKESSSADVYNDGTGVLFGHWRGTGTYTITGELDASKTFVELRYSAGAQTINVDGGTVKAKGIHYVSVNGSTGDVLVNLSNGATVETTGATGLKAPIAVLSGDNTYKSAESFETDKALTLTGGSLAVEVAENKTVTFSGTVSGTGVFKKTGVGDVAFTASAPAQIVLCEGTVKVPSGYAGTVASGARGYTVTKRIVEGGVVYKLSLGFAIFLQ